MEDEEETLCRYGTALPAFEEDAVPPKRPITVEDQIVLDSNGKRRFHGAFTGGFSAGYWNTVGSEEGWTPREFKSSRGEKSSTRVQNAMDFMDEEDLGEFGFAPQRVQTRDDFAHNSSTGLAGERANKRKLDMSVSKGPIPGQPVLRALLQPAKEKTAVKMLKKMGWREGQGIGERQTRREKKRTKERNCKEQYIMKTYGCEMPGQSSAKDIESFEDPSESSDSESDVTFAPDDFDPLVASLKDNTFGLGYSGLDRGTAKGGFNLFDTFEVVGKNNKKLSIRGQAFGIGALEDDDDLDVYARDDMSRYDFSLEDGKSSKKGVAAIKSGQQGNALEGFCAASLVQKLVKRIFRSQMPEGFNPRNWTERRSRFDPMDEESVRKRQHDTEYKIRGLGRHDLCPKERGEIIGEKPIVRPTSPSAGTAPLKEPIKEGDPERKKAATGNVDEENPSPTLIPQGLLKQPSVLLRQYIGSTKEGFKPFISDPDKQERYERFLAFQPTEQYIKREQYLDSLQPLNLSAWERERELKEFMQAERMYRPLDGLMAGRFVTASSLIADKTISNVEGAPPPEVKMKRTRTMWTPHKDLCRRFNVPEPFGGLMVGEEPAAGSRKQEKGKFSVFDYLEAPVTNRRDFITPVIIPRATPSGGDKPNHANVAGGHRLSSKDFFETDKSQTQDNGELKVDGKASTSTVVGNVAPKKVEKPRSELEQKVLEASNKKTEEKRDLFKSIFCSSDEEGEHEGGGAQTEKEPNRTLTDEEKMKMVDSIVAVKPANQINILRNNSPPRGIFKSLFEFKKPQPNEPADESASGKLAPAVPTDESNEKGKDSSGSDSSSDTEGESYYGPKLPTMDKTAPGPPERDGQQEEARRLDDRLRQLLGAGEAKTSRKSEIWIEKTTERPSSGRDKKKKKHKEHKEHHRRSKSKSKHKKDRKKSTHKHKSKH